ncbi:MAG: AzlC family ABC transporter permease [Candidatus Limnocylindrales bacterium]
MPADLRVARRQLLIDSAGIAVSAIGFALVFGLAARNAGYSLLEASAMSVFGFAGAAQFAAVGYVAQGLPWAPIVILTFFLNARHALYSASLAPRLRHVPFLQRAAMAHVLTDEAFALAATHFHRLGRVDVPGYWIGAVLGVFIPWNLATIAGYLLGSAIPDPSALGLDIVFPAAMAGLAVGLMTGRREVAAAGSGAAIGVLLSLAVGPGVGIVAGGLIGPLVGMAVPVPANPEPAGRTESTAGALRSGESADAELAGAASPARADATGMTGAHHEGLNPLPSVPLGRFDIDEALDEADADAAADRDPDPGPAAKPRELP